MAKYTVKHSCGHDEIHDIQGPVKNRDSKADWLAGRVCGECYAIAKRAEEAAATAEVNAGLPALLGTGKQVAWAESIRARLLTKTREKVEDLVVLQFSRKPKAAARARAALDRVVVKHADARYWIDSQHAESLIEEVVKEFSAMLAAEKSAASGD